VFAGGALWAGGPRSRSGGAKGLGFPRSFRLQEELRRKAVPPTIPSGGHVCRMCYDRTRTVQKSDKAATTAARPASARGTSRPLH